MDVKNNEETKEVVEISSSDLPDTSSSISEQIPPDVNDEDDPIVAEYEVYLSNTLSDRLYLLQFPLQKEFVFY